ncbi:MAG: Citrate synthase 1 [Legionellaceae bacterium]
MAELRIGLEGVAVAESKISSVNGEKGEFIYRGYWAEEVVKNHTYEDIVHLLWFGHLPSESEASNFKNQLASKRTLPEYIKAMIQLLPKSMPSMSVLRTVISALEDTEADRVPTTDQALEILAKAPTIITYHYNYINGIEERQPRMDLSHAANYLYMLHGEEPAESHIRALDTYLMLSADHDMNASTFTSRVITSTRAGIISAIVGAIGALIGPLHGGAPSKVDDMLDAIGTEENVEKWLREQLENGERLMGFGHRVYKTYDPRAAALREVTQEFADENHLFKLSLLVEKVAIKLLEEYKPGRNLYPNLEFWAAGVLRTIRLPRELYTSTFCLSRIAGWSAQIIEQAANNRLIRPSCIYIGPKPTTPAPHKESII